MSNKAAQGIHYNEVCIDSIERITMCCNKHLTSVEREMILKFRATGCSITEIAQRPGRNKATVSRKLQRNSINGEYIPAAAEELYQERRMKFMIQHRCI